jgi:hypothetical protein
MVQRPTYKRYTLSAEAEAMRVERNRLQNERLKDERAKARAEKGLPPKPTKNERKQQMKIYMQNKRAAERITNSDQIAAEKAEREQKRIAIRDARREEAKLRKAAKLKEDRRLARLNGKPDLRTRTGRTKPHYKHSKPKVTKPAPVKRESYDRGTKIKPVKKSERVLVNRAIDLAQCIPVKIDAKTTVYVKPGADVEEVRQRFLQKKAFF